MSTSGGWRSSNASTAMGTGRVPGTALGMPDTGAVWAAVPPDLLALASTEPQKAFPAMARDGSVCARVRHAVQSLRTGHRLYNIDSRSMELEPGSVDLVVTSPPYWTLKTYNDHQAQLGAVQDYDQFLDELDAVWRRVYDALVPGGRLVIVAGDVNVSRRAHGRHVVFPLHASLQERCRQLGYDNLAPIIWHKIANAHYEVGASGYFGKPFEPNGVIKNDVEYILFQRKPGGYRKPNLAARVLSVIPAAEHAELFQQIWHVTGASTANHPAPYPLILAERLVRMFSFAGDTVLDPFLGTGTTSVAAARWGRNSIGFEVDPEYFRGAVARVAAAVEARRKQPRPPQPT